VFETTNPGLTRSTQPERNGIAVWGIVDKPIEFVVDETVLRP